MAKYVESEPLDRELQELIKQHNRKCESDNSDGVLEALHRLRLAPAADVAPVVRGLPMLKCRPQRYVRYEEAGLNEQGEMLYLKRGYVDEKNYAMYCPACGKRLCSRFTNYCPHCGAKMDL